MTDTQADALGIDASRADAPHRAGPSTLTDSVAGERTFWREALVFSVLVLIAIGFVMALTLDGPKRGVWPALSARAARVLLGLLAFWLALHVRLDRLRPLVLPIYVTALSLCVLPRALGDSTNGAYRWIEIGSASFQPVELVKVLAVLATAEVLERRRPLLDQFVRGLLPVLCVPVSAALVLLTQPDVGHAFFLIAICGVLVFVGGMRLRHGIPLFTLASAALVLAVQTFGHTQSRVGAFASGEPGLQMGRGLRAFAEGGLAGLGPGAGWIKMGWVPEARNDFVLAIVGNELGIFGSLLVVAMFTLLLWSGLRIACLAGERWHLLVALGLTITIVLQGCLNILGVTFTIPEKGIDLPFISSGGTNLVFALASIGLLCNIGRSIGRNIGAVVGLGSAGTERYLHGADLQHAREPAGRAAAPIHRAGS